MMRKIFFVVIGFLLALFADAQDYALNGQDSPYTDSLKHSLETARTDEEKIQWLSQLANFYITINKDLSEEYARRQIEIAELSRDRGLMVKALIFNAQRYFTNSNGIQENLDKAKKFSEQAFELAKTIQRDDLMVQAYIVLAYSAQKDGQFDKALNYSNLAVSLSSTQDDSLKISALKSLGNTYMARKEKLLAFRNFLQAVNLAEDLHKFDLLVDCYYSMANFYSDLDELEKAKDYLFKIEKLTFEFSKPYHRLHLYNSLGRVYTSAKQYDMATGFYKKSMALADTLKFELVKLNSHFAIFNQYLNSNAKEALDYFNQNKVLKDFMIKANLEHQVYYAYAIAYTSLSRFDSAEYYFKKAEPAFLTRTNPATQYGFFSGLGRYYAKKGNDLKSLDYFLKAKNIADSRKDLGMLKNISMNLDSAYQRLGDFKNAFYYNGQFHQYKDSLEKLSTEKDLLLMEVENENKRKEKEALAEQETLRERHNVQYMGITAAIAVVFIFLVMLGLFSVSKTTIKILGFFAFIFLFEFIILLADHQIHDWTHGEPWKILAIKIVLISILLPFHHFLEKRVIHYLTTRKMIEINRKTLFNKITGKAETDPVH